MVQLTTQPDNGPVPLRDWIDRLIVVVSLEHGVPTPRTDNRLQGHLCVQNVVHLLIQNHLLCDGT